MADAIGTIDAIFTDERQQIAGTIKKKQKQKKTRHTVAAAFELCGSGSHGVGAWVT